MKLLLLTPMMLLRMPILIVLIFQDMMNKTKKNNSRMITCDKS